MPSEGIIQKTRASQKEKVSAGTCNQAKKTTILHVKRYVTSTTLWKSEELPMMMGQLPSILYSTKAIAIMRRV